MLLAEIQHDGAALEHGHRLAWRREIYQGRRSPIGVQLDILWSLLLIVHDVDRDHVVRQLELLEERSDLPRIRRVGTIEQVFP